MSAIQALMLAGSRVSAAAGQQAYTTPGTYSWICPAGVTSVSAVCVGPGSLSGGCLRYKNGIAVVPGATYTVVVGAANSTTDSYFISTATVLGRAGLNAVFSGGAVTNGGVGDGGGNGGYGDTSDVGGGAGGYSGNGGNGGVVPDTYSRPIYGGTAGAGGGGGGGSKYQDGYYASHTGGGGGVGLLGEGASGAGGVVVVGAQAGGGGGGSGGAVGADGLGSGGSFNGTGGLYGGGGGTSTGTGAGGAVRIIWAGTSGTTRAFPSTNTGNL